MQMIHWRCNLLKQVSESTIYTPGDLLEHSILPAFMRGLICRLDSSSEVCPSPVCVVFSPHREEHEVSLSLPLETCISLWTSCGQQELSTSTHYVVILWGIMGYLAFPEHPGLVRFPL